MPVKPSIAQVHDFLRRRDGLIVHFSGTPPGVPAGAGHTYPADLHHVIGGGARSGVACSVVLPTDTFAGAGVRHATGCIGVILDLESPDSLIRIAPGDAGSHMVNGVRIYDAEPDITIQDCENSISLRAGYNEWGIRNYRVLGVFAAPPFEVWKMNPVPGPDYTTLTAVKTEFSDQAVFTVAYDRLWASTHASGLYKI